MLDHAVLTSVAEQMMGETELPHPSTGSGQAFSQDRREVGHPKEVDVEGKSWPVMRTGTRRLRTIRFEIGGKGYQAIEQNAEKPSRWGQLAREGHKVVQFREVGSGKYVAVAVDGKVTEYG